MIWEYSVKQSFQFLCPCTIYFVNYRVFQTRITYKLPFYVKDNKISTAPIRLRTSHFLEEYSMHFLMSSIVIIDLSCWIFLNHHYHFSHTSRENVVLFSWSVNKYPKNKEQTIECQWYIFNKINCFWPWLPGHDRNRAVWCVMRKDMKQMLYQLPSSEKFIDPRRIK